MQTRHPHFVACLSSAVLTSALLCGQQKPIERERLIAAGKLWVAIHYFHPYLAWNDVDWDQALLKTIPKIKTAKSRDDYIAALQGMLAELRDPATQIIPPEEARGSGALGFASAELLRDGVLLVKSGRMAAPLGSADKVSRLLPQARAIVFDFREGAVHSWLLGGTQLSTRPIIRPGYRLRMQSGVHPDRGGWASPYFSGSWTRDGSVTPPSTGARDLPVVFLVRDGQQVPDLVPALQDSGNGFLIAEQAVDGAALISAGLATTYVQSLGEGIQVQIRLAEVVHPDGTTGLCADRVLTGDSLAAALDLARQPARGECRRPALPGPSRQRVNPSYAAMQYPPAEHRMLAAFRIWGVFEHLYPYRELMDRQWESVLQRSLRKFEDAQDALAYHLAVAEMVSDVHDTHAEVSSPVLTQHWGLAIPGIALRPVEGKAVVTAIVDEAARKSGVRVGDVVNAIDGTPAEVRVRDLSRYISASTPQSSLRDAVGRLLRGSDRTTVSLTLEGERGLEKKVNLVRTTDFAREIQKAEFGESVRLMPGDVGYIDLRQLTRDEVDTAFERLRQAKGIVFDMRGYPQNTRTLVARWLSAEPTIAAGRIARRITLSPESSAKQELINQIHLLLDPKQHYSGPTVMLIDERAQSQSEETGLVLRAANGTKFVGTPTAGANGDGSAFYVPGGIYIGLTGQGVWHPDGRQLQRVGLIPDVEIAPTIRGIRQGRDEVLERALAYLTGQ
jgi:C-terminal processing protease CtpA/Prc